MSQITLEEAGRLVVVALMSDLAESEWRDNHPQAFVELGVYLYDMKATVMDVLEGKTIFEEGA